MGFLDQAKNAASNVGAAVDKGKRDTKTTAGSAAKKVKKTATDGRRTVEHAVSEAKKHASTTASDGAQAIKAVTAGVVDPFRTSADLSAGNVNGDKFYTPDELYALMLTAINKHVPDIKVTVHNPEVIAAFSSLAAHSGAISTS